MTPKVEALIEIARPLVTCLQIDDHGRSAATVASALRSSSGRIYTGVCIDMTCGIGFCAEHAAVAEMLKAGETHVESIVAVTANDIYPPCGRCRELLAQLNYRNADTRVILNDSVVTLRELLPHHPTTEK